MTELFDTNGTAPPLPPKPKGRPQTLNCPNCGGSVTIKAPGHTISAVCSYCSSVIDVANDNLRLIQTAHEKTRHTLLEIGVKGLLQGTRWEVIGYMEKTDDSGIYHWDEYLLYNPYQGFRFLVQSNGHWSIAKVLKKDIAGAGINYQLYVDGHKYSIFLKGGAKVAYVKGEFYWRAQVGERVSVVDYINPPRAVSVELADEDINVALLDYIEAAEIVKSFDIKQEMPRKSGVAANQPNPYQANSGKIWLTTFVAMALATTLQIMSSAASDNAPVFEQTFEIQPADKDKTVSSESFTLPKKTNLSIESYSPVNNDWLELNLSLVNDNGETADTSQVIEYYSGVDEDGSWSEGSQFTDSFVPALSEGNYHLLIDADAGAFEKAQSASFSVKIKRDVPVWSNYWLTMLLLLVYPGYVFYRGRSFESKRWEESDLSGSYHYSDDDY